MARICLYVDVWVAPSMIMGVWPKAVMLWQPQEYYYYCYILVNVLIQVYLSHEVNLITSQQVCQFHKTRVPDDPDEKAEFAQKLQVYCVSLQQYQSAFEQPDVTLQVTIVLLMLYMYCVMSCQYTCI